MPLFRKREKGKLAHLILTLAGELLIEHQREQIKRIGVSMGATAHWDGRMPPWCGLINELGRSDQEPGGHFGLRTATVRRPEASTTALG
jgi:hypothetical protein